MESLEGEAVSKNAEPLGRFVAFCERHPELRFWQALCVWTGMAKIFAQRFDDQSTALEDTFYWEDQAR